MHLFAPVFFASLASALGVLFIGAAGVAIYAVFLLTREAIDGFLEPGDTGGQAK